MTLEDGRIKTVPGVGWWAGPEEGGLPPTFHEEVEAAVVQW